VTIYNMSDSKLPVAEMVNDENDKIHEVIPIAQGTPTHYAANLYQKSDVLRVEKKPSLYNSLQKLVRSKKKIQVLDGGKCRTKKKSSRYKSRKSKKTRRKSRRKSNRRRGQLYRVTSIASQLK
jgi:hypothetical protein